MISHRIKNSEWREEILIGVLEALFSPLEELWVNRKIQMILRKGIFELNHELYWRNIGCCWRSSNVRWLRKDFKVKFLQKLNLCKFIEFLHRPHNIWVLWIFQQSFSIWVLFARFLIDGNRHHRMSTFLSGLEELSINQQIDSKQAHK